MSRMGRERNSSISALGLQQNAIGPLGAMALAAALPSLEMLRELLLYSNQLGAMMRDETKSFFGIQDRKMEVSIVMGVPLYRWMVKGTSGTSHLEMDDDWGTPILGNLHLACLRFVDGSRIRSIDTRFPGGTAKLSGPQGAAAICERLPDPWLFLMIEQDYRGGRLKFRDYHRLPEFLDFEKEVHLRLILDSFIASNLKPVQVAGPPRGWQERDVSDTGLV